MSTRSRIGPVRAASHGLWALVPLFCTALLPSCTGNIEGALGPHAPGGAASSSAQGSGALGSGSVELGNTAQPLDCTQLDVGMTPLQRLSRTQYVNSVRDLFGVVVVPDALPDDERVGAFEGNVVGSVSDLELETYMAVAENVAQNAMASFEALQPCDRATLGDGACAAQFIRSVGRRVYRRPLSDDEQATLTAMYTSYQQGGYSNALRVVVQTMLQSPAFLYRVEPASADAKSSISALDAFELAARLSFFLVSSTPDDELLDAAASGELLDDDALTAQVDRLLADARFLDTVDAFYLQWLEIGDVQALTRDAARYPSFNQDLATAMRKETLSFARYVMTQDGATLSTLLTAPYSFPEGPALALYGLSAVGNAPGQPVQLDPSERAGLLTQPSFLATHAHYDQSAPVLRGKVVIQNIFCQALPSPPANVDTTPPAPTADATTRELLVEHVTNPACAGCHERIDGVGLGFENFDAIGAYRAKESNKPVDASGSIVGTPHSDGSFVGVPDLARQLVKSADVQQCITTQWTRFALGRLESELDRCSLDSLYKDFVSSDLELHALLRSIALSPLFRSKRISLENNP